MGFHHVILEEELYDREFVESYINGWDISNINILMDNSHESMDPAIGATNLRVCLCNIAPAE